MWLDKYYLHVEKGGRRIVSNERNRCQIAEGFVLVWQKSNPFTSAEPRCLGSAAGGAVPLGARPGGAGGCAVCTQLVVPSSAATVFCKRGLGVPRSRAVELPCFERGSGGSGAPRRAGVWVSV